MRRLAVFVALAALVAMIGAGQGQAGPRQTKGPARTYLVLYAKGASPAQAHRAIARAGGVITTENTAIGLATVKSTNRSFVSEADSSAALLGAARNIPIGYAPNDRPHRWSAIEGDRTLGASKTGARSHAAVDAEPFAGLQWDMEMIHATADGSYAAQPGDAGVKVGIIDTGIDGSHPDIAPNFDADLSRNFTVDDPVIDGEDCEHPELSCKDPADEDDDGHGTHTAGTVGAALNGFGLAGVAPGITLVNLRAGQDSGYFFLGPVVDALTYAGDNGIDVVNMSFYTDPWLYNCKKNPADSPAAQKEQRMIIGAHVRALQYAHEHGVTLIAALGNEDTDLGKPKFDPTSPDYPPGYEYDRDVTNACVNLPTEGKHVISVSALGPTQRKAYYSNWGVEQTDVSAPGGDRREFFGTPEYNSVHNRVLSTYPKNVAEAAGDLNPDGTPNTPFVEEYCSDPDHCAYYQYLQGTSMASPHAVGVAALIVSQFGSEDAEFGGLTMNPDEVQAILEGTATDHPCPDPRRYKYPDLDRSFWATCSGDPEFNGFYGNGIVDALAAVSEGP